jgi:glycosyltransferase involved in cell wall biosynthesis
MMKLIVITPARNEAAFIEATMMSMMSQTMVPAKWIVVSDGSTDGTDEIVEKYQVCHDWIELVRLPEHADRHFAAKVRAFNAGYERAKRMEYDIVGNLDADLTFAPEYFAYLIDKFDKDPRLGVAGTPFIEDAKAGHYDYRYTNIEHVSGACQLFRRQCFEEIGGYSPIPGGGIDWVAVTTARMKGWKTRTFTEMTLFHHRKMGTAKSSVLSSHYKQGVKDYNLGGHPLWEVFRAMYQMKRRPYFLGGIGIMLGYLAAAVRRAKRPISKELITFNQHEQMQRLFRKLHRP